MTRKKIASYQKNAFFYKHIEKFKETFQCY